MHLHLYFLFLMVLLSNFLLFIFKSCILETTQFPASNDLNHITPAAGLCQKLYHGVQNLWTFTPILRYRKRRLQILKSVLWIVHCKDLPLPGYWPVTNLRSLWLWIMGWYLHVINTKKKRRGEVTDGLWHMEVRQFQ